MKEKEEEGSPYDPFKLDPSNGGGCFFPFFFFFLIKRKMRERVFLKERGFAKEWYFMLYVVLSEVKKKGRLLERKERERGAGI